MATVLRGDAASPVPYHAPPPAPVAPPARTPLEPAPPADVRPVEENSSVEQPNRAEVANEAAPPAPGEPLSAIDRATAPSWSPRVLNWASVVWLVILHSGAIAALFFVRWEAVALAVFLHWFTGGLGICLGYHRMLTHMSFRTSRPMRYTISTLGVLAGEGTPIDWVADHRKHHAHSDHEGDPHSPRDGAVWSHILWLIPGRSTAALEAHRQRWAPDLAKDPVMRFLGRAFLPLHFLTGLILLTAGWLLGGASLGLSLLLWGLCVRLVFVLHATWLVNSASHMWGYRNYVTADDSRNNWLVALVTYGEGWHNNHHAYPRMANHGHKWWEIDLTFRMIRLLERVGLVWDVVDYKHAGEKRKAA